MDEYNSIKSTIQYNTCTLTNDACVDECLGYSNFLFRMTTNASNSNVELASEFITRTCQLIPKLFLDYFDHMHNLKATKIPVPTNYVIICGSHAEFYIRPLITCIDDEDYLIIKVDKLVFSEKFPVLPSDLSGLAETIECFIIEPYERYPGFVRLRLLGEMNYNWKLKEYIFNYAANTITYTKLNLDGIAENYSLQTLQRGTFPNIVNGPAIKHLNQDQMRNFPTFDHVTCLWCPQWPKEAQRWLYRPRCHGWPSTDIISEVEQSGCHLVYIQ